MNDFTTTLILSCILSGSATAQVSVSYFSPGRQLDNSVDTGTFYLSTVNDEPWGHLPYNVPGFVALSTINTPLPFSTQGFTYELRGGGGLAQSAARNISGATGGTPVYSGDGFELTGEDIYSRGPFLGLTINPTEFTNPTIVLGNLPVGGTVSFSLLAVPDNINLESLANFGIGDFVLGPTADASFQTDCLLVPESGELEFPLFAASGDPDEAFDFYFEAGRVEVCAIPEPSLYSFSFLALGIGLTRRTRKWSC